LSWELIGYQPILGLELICHLPTLGLELIGVQQILGSELIGHGFEVEWSFFKAPNARTAFPTARIISSISARGTCPKCWVYRGTSLIRTSPRHLGEHAFVREGPARPGRARLGMTLESLLYIWPTVSWNLSSELGRLGPEPTAPPNARIISSISARGTWGTDVEDAVQTFSPNESHIFKTVS